MKSVNDNIKNLVSTKISFNNYYVDYNSEKVSLIRRKLREVVFHIAFEIWYIAQWR